MANVRSAKTVQAYLNLHPDAEVTLIEHGAATVWLDGRPVWNVHEDTVQRLIKWGEPKFVALFDNGEAPPTGLQETYAVQSGHLTHAYTGWEVVSYIKARVEQILADQEIVRAAQARIDARKAQVLPFLIALGPDVKVDLGGKVSFEMPREEVVFDAHQLDGLVKADRFKYGFLTRYRSVSVVKGKVIVK